MMKKSITSQVIASILVNSVYAMKGYPSMLISNLLQPISIILLISFVSHGTLVGLAVAGGLMMTFVSGGLSLQSDLTHLKNDFKFQDMIVSSPTGASTYLLGMAISELIYIIPSLVLLVVLASIYIPATSGIILEIVAVMLLLYAFATVLAFFLSTFLSDIMQSWGFFGIITLLLTTIAPVYYPITYIPLPYRYIAYLSPTTYAAGIVQSALGYIQSTPQMIEIDWTVLIVVSIALFAIALTKNRWREP